MRKLIAILLSLLLVVSCATFHTASYATLFESQLRLLEEYDRVKRSNDMLPGGELFYTYFPKLNAIAAEIGWKPVFGGKIVTEDGLELWGYTEIETHTIYISLDQSPNNFIHTYIHELSHAKQPMPLTSNDGQVFAETVACIVTERLGVESRPDSFAFIRQYDNHFEVLERYASQIDQLVQFFLSRLQ